MNSIEGGECVKYAVGKTSGRANSGLGVETQIVQDQTTTAITSSFNTWPEHGSVFTEPESLCSTKETADSFSEVLTNTQWDSVESMNRDIPNGSDNWATFSPVALSTSYHSIESWALETLVENSSEEAPFIKSDNGSVGLLGVGEAGGTSPGWCAFSLGKDRGIITSSSTWPNTSSSSAPDISSSMNSTLYPTMSSVGRSNEPCVNQTPSVLPSSHHQSCEAVFRQCFNSSETTTSESSNRVKEHPQEGDTVCGSPVVTTRCIGDWQCLKNDRFECTIHCITVAIKSLIQPVYQSIYTSVCAHNTIYLNIYAYNNTYNVLQYLLSYCPALRITLCICIHLCTFTMGVCTYYCMYSYTCIYTC